MKKYLLVTVVIVSMFSLYFVANLFYKKLILDKVSKRKETIFLLIINLLKYGGLIIGLFIILYLFDVDTASVLAGAGVLGILLGFGLQKLIQDMVNGFFIIFENQYVVGEFVTINEATGRVLELGLKTTKILTYRGELYYFSNGDIKSVVNHSRNNSLLVIDLPILHKYKTDEVINIINSVLKRIKHHSIISEPRILGVNDISEFVYFVRITCQTYPFEYFEASRLIKTEIIKCLNDNGIEYFDFNFYSH